MEKSRATAAAIKIHFTVMCAIAAIPAAERIRQQLLLTVIPMTTNSRAPAGSAFQELSMTLGIH